MAKEYTHGLTASATTAAGSWANKTERHFSPTAKASKKRGCGRKEKE
jgi:hypothetical protein